MKQHRGMGYANKKTQACQMAQAKMKIISANAESCRPKRQLWSNGRFPNASTLKLFNIRDDFWIYIAWRENRPKIA